MLPEYSIRLNALVPIWTGDGNGATAKHILETGILGSLRWWTEALVRGMGIQVPDSPADDSSSPVAKLFGSTSHQRAFRLDVIDEMMPHEHTELCEGERKITYELVDLPGNPARLRDSHATAHPSWAYRGQLRSGALTLALTRHSPQTANIIHAVLKIASRWGGIGARPSFGCGRFALLDEPEGYDGFTAWLEDIARQEQPVAAPGTLPTLQKIFRADVPVPQRLLGAEKGMVRDETHFRIRYRVREAYRSSTVPADERHRVCGWVRNDRVGSYAAVRNENATGSVFAISFPYRTVAEGQDMLRVWGWRPSDINNTEMLRKIQSGYAACFPSAPVFQFREPSLSSPATPAEVLALLNGAESDV